MSLKGKSKEELFNIWKKRIRIARDLHKEKVVQWSEKVFKEFSGENQTNLDTNEKYAIVAQMIQATEQTIQPHLMLTNPKFFAKAKDNMPEWERRQDEVAQMVNYEYEDLKDTGYGIELENELTILDARLLLFGIVTGKQT